MRYAILTEWLEDVKKKLDRVAKKCVKHGNPFTYEICEEEVREFENENGVIEYYKFTIVNVEGTAKIDNWECVAVLEVHSAGNVIRRINTEIELPERFKHTENVCEHCNSKRFRNNLYVIHNVETDEWKQVGGSCLRLYTGGLSLEYVAAYLDGVTELEENDGFVPSGCKRYYPVEEVLGYATNIVDKIGYYNASSDHPTKNLVTYMTIFDDKNKAISELNKDIKQLGVWFTRKDFFKRETEDKVKGMIEYYLSLNPDTEFIHNIQVMLTEGYVLAKGIGFLAYLPEGYNKYLKVEKEREEREKAAANSQYFGEVGKRYKNQSIKAVNLIADWESNFGVTYVYKITLDNYAVLTWKTSNCLFLERGEDFDKIDFTVKAHTEYRGQKQTEVTRCKITKKVVEKRPVDTEGVNLDIMSVFEDVE